MNSCCNSGAALLGLLLLAACTESGAPTPLSASLCQADTTPINLIQGDGWYSLLQETTVTTRGTVTHISESHGVYIEDNAQAWDGKRSRALFIADESLSLSALPGQVMAVNGQVAERGTSRDKQTSIIEVGNFEICADQSSLPQTRIALPLNSKSREALESMRVSLEQTLTVTDVYKLSSGEFTLSGSGVLRIPTEVKPPGKAAAEQERKNRNHSIVARLPKTGVSAMPVGSQFDDLSGLLGHNGRGQQLWLEGAPRADMPEPDTLKPAAAGYVRIVSSNLLNFFNGDGSGGGFPTDRGAKTYQEFLARATRTRAAITRIQPHLLAVQELENDGFGPRSAVQTLLDLLNQSGNTDWAFIRPGSDRIGTDVITVGLLYRQQVLEAVGKAHMLQSPEFDGLSRQPLAQLFRDRRSGVEFLAAANHLKSKGSCPDSGHNADQDDGQGCWNPARVAAVATQIEWLENLGETLGTTNIMILGDMNAYRMEDPVASFKAASYIDLVEQISGLPQHSFLYRGQTGTLDYLFASPAVAGYARAAQIWHINATLARNMDHPQPWLRASDHDPVIVDFDFSQPSTLD
ncbi:MAG: ExeM/NucH family extracellular endonuclease [Xanthomonadales bacterium]|nr:ExeM/NucH family extracellular endonuclease [Xanthomonadales bacterium]